MPYVYSQTERRYRDQGGRFVSQSRVRAAANSIVVNGESRAAALTDELLAGRLSPADWRELFQEQVKHRDINEYLLGRGGRNAMTSEDWGRIGRFLRDEYRRLDGFQSDIEAGLLSDAEIRSRARQYMRHARALYERGAAAAYGLASTLPAFPGDDTTECDGGCHCTWRFEHANLGNPDEADWDCFWDIDTTAENCVHCVNRSIEWFPLRVRNGVVQPYSSAGLFV